MSVSATSFTLGHDSGVFFITLCSDDGLNRLTLESVEALADEVEGFASHPLPVLPIVLSGEKCFSAGADLNEIASLTGPEALRFAAAGHRLTQAIDDYPGPVVAAIAGFCMGGGLDLALASDRRIASPDAVFGHRGAALGLMTGWGGTQRLPRLIGRGRALQMFAGAEKLTARAALHIGLIDAIAEDPAAAAFAYCMATRTAALPRD